MSDKVTALPWDGSSPDSCDHVGCPNAVVVRADLRPIMEGHTGYEAEAYVCADHLDDLPMGARQVLVINRLVQPATPAERNMLAIVQEHLP